MSVLDWVALAAAIVCVVTYWRDRQWFDIANATLWPVVALASALRGAWASVLLAVAFGLVGAVHWWKSLQWYPVDVEMWEDGYEATIHSYGDAVWGPDGWAIDQVILDPNVPSGHAYLLNPKFIDPEDNARWMEGS